MPQTEPSNEEKSLRALFTQIFERTALVLGKQRKDRAMVSYEDLTRHIEEQFDAMIRHALSRK
jgi:hypothetical protein